MTNNRVSVFSLRKSQIVVGDSRYKNFLWAGMVRGREGERMRDVVWEVHKRLCYVTTGGRSKEYDDIEKRNARITLIALFGDEDLIREEGERCGIKNTKKIIQDTITWVVGQLSLNDEGIVKEREREDIETNIFKIR